MIDVPVMFPPVMVTLLEFWVAIVPRPVTLATGTELREIVTLPVKAPPPDNNPEDNTLTVLGTAPGTLATGTLVKSTVTLPVSCPPPVSRPEVLT